MMGQEKPLHSYGNEFNTKSAEEVIPFIVEKLNTSSVIDIGCGIATWLSVFQQMGTDEVLGVDRDHVLKSNKFIIPASNFFAKDLTELKFQDINQRYELAL